MAVTELEPLRISDTVFRLRYSSDLETPTFYIWRDSVLLATTSDTTYDVYVQSGESACFDILDDAAEEPDYNQPSQAKIWWQSADSTEYYDVELYSGGSWSSVAKIYDIGRSMYTYVTPVLTNNTTYQYRVTAVASDGNESTPITWSILTRRRPTPPEWTYTWTKATTTMRITIS